MKKLLSVLGNIFIVLLLAFSIVLTATVLLSTRNKNRIPSAFGYSVLSVLSDSMEAEGGFYTGDLIVIRNLNSEEANNLKVGDVITFVSEIGEVPVLETHRIIKDTFTEYQNQVVDGIWKHGDLNYYATQGDNTVAADQWLDARGIYYSHVGNIIGIWEGVRIPHMGTVMSFLQSPNGFMICVVIPIALFFMYELYVFIITLSRKKKEEALAAVSDKEAELKAAAVAEFLAQQQKEAGATAEEDTKPEAAEEKPKEEKKSKKKEKASEEQTEDNSEEKSEEAPAEDKEEPKAEEKPAEISEEEKAKIIAEYMAKQAEEMRKKEAENK